MGNWGYTTTYRSYNPIYNWQGPTLQVPCRLKCSGVYYLFCRVRWAAFSLVANKNSPRRKLQNFHSTGFPKTEESVISANKKMKTSMLLSVVFYKEFPHQGIQNPQNSRVYYINVVNSSYNPPRYHQTNQVFIPINWVFPKKKGTSKWMVYNGKPYENR